MDWYDVRPDWRYDADFNGIVVKDPATGALQLWPLPEPAWKMAIKRALSSVLHFLSQNTRGSF